MGDSNYSHFRSESSLRAGLLMWQIFPPILIVAGSIGNVLSIMVLSRPNLRKATYSVYLLGLSVADLCMLYIGLLRQWVKYVFDVDVRFTSSVVCKLHQWAVYTNADICAWILTVITVERVVSTLRPTKVNVFCTVRTAKVCIAVTVLVFSIINSHIFYGFGEVQETTGNVTSVLPCAPGKSDYKLFYRNVWSWVDLCKASLVPFVILAVGNACIIRKLFQSSRRASLAVAPSRFNTSRLLVTLNFMFILCTAPVCIYFIGDSYWVPADVPRHVQANDPVWALVNLLLYINNTVNFLLYCLSGSKFRRELVKIFKGISRASLRTISSGLHRNASSSF